MSADPQQKQLEAALLEAATILPDEGAIVRGKVLSSRPSVAYAAGAAQPEHAQHPDAERVLLRAGSQPIENLEPAVTYRVAVRARLCGGDGSDPAGGWGGWCSVVDMQTLAAAWNPPPVVESPAEGCELRVGGGPTEIRWSGRQVVTQVLISSRTGLFTHALPVDAPSGTEQAEGGCVMWDGTMWESGGAEASPYVATPAPASFPVFLYLKFVGSDGVETYTPARRIIMTCAQPCLLLRLLGEELLASEDCLCVVLCPNLLLGILKALVFPFDQIVRCCRSCRRRLRPRIRAGRTAQLQGSRSTYGGR